MPKADESNPKKRNPQTPKKVRWGFLVMKSYGFV